MSVMTHTYTKTFTILTPWAETEPWTCLIHPTNCVSATHDHSPMANDLCAVEDCCEPLVENETCYAVTELPRLAAWHERWVCWRHIRPDKGPLRITAASRLGALMRDCLSDTGA